MEQTVETFFHEFRQEILARADAASTYQLEAFMVAISDELIETGFIEGFEFCHYRSQRGLRVDGYWFNDEGVLEVFVADFDCREDLETLTSSEVNAAFKRGINFIESSFRGVLKPDITTPEYGLVHQIAARRESIDRINIYLTSERVLSDRFQDYSGNEIEGISVTYHVWDMSRVHRQRTSRGRKEPLDIDFLEMFGRVIPCLPANLNSEKHQSFLIVMPAMILADLYEKYGSRLLEQNIRTFLQARAKVNKGLQSTILNEPEMFFAYNNGITATAQSIQTEADGAGMHIVRMTDLQIVNGGQTTASLYHTRKKHKVSLSDIFVQMKLSVIDREHSESVVPRISEYANTQNRVNAADFFSNHPFHVRMEEFSRRLWAPAQRGSQRETKWFYERARGQYVDDQSKLTPAEQKRFKAEYPKHQMFTKTDLAKYENVFDEHPRWVNHGSQKNFAEYAKRIGKEWEDSADGFNEVYFKRAVARGILFRATEKLVSGQSWYSGGYRANIVAYTLSMLGELTKGRKASLDYLRIWSMQEVDALLTQVLVTIASVVHDCIMNPPSGVSNVSEWCKQQSCWTALLRLQERVAKMLPDEFWGTLVLQSEAPHLAKEAISGQRIENDADCQKKVIEIGATTWKHILKEGKARKQVSEKEEGILLYACQIPKKIPSPAQSRVLMEVYARAVTEGYGKA